MFANEESSPWPSAATPPRDVGSASVAFRAALRAAWPSAEAEGKVVAAFAEYSEVLQEAWQRPEVAQRASDRYAEYLRSVQEAFAASEARSRVQDAYRAYVVDLQQAWARLDVTALTPSDLARMAEAIAWVAGMATEIFKLEGVSPHIGGSA